jgi:DNA-binding transcriptional LysR family regulator
VASGSFSKAADQLEMSRPAVTLTIKGLESELGVRLLHRTTRTTTPTAEGAAYFVRVTRILEDVAEARARVTAGRGRRAVRGKLRVDIPVALSKSLIIPALKQFRDSYPEIELVIGISDNPVDLVADGIDCVVRIGDLKDSSLVVRRIGQARLLTCASPSYLTARGTSSTLDDLVDHSVVGFFSGRSRKMLDWSFVLGGKESAVKLKAALLVNDSEALVEAGLAGLGVFQALDVGVQRHIDSGALQLVLPLIETPSRAISVLLPSKRHTPPHVRVFVDWVSRLMANHQKR